jgi:formate dehydrogenase accessory protein FdhD
VLADERPIQLLLNGDLVTTLLASHSHLVELCLGHFATEHGLSLERGRWTVEHNRINNVERLNLVVDGQEPLPRRQGVVTTSCGACNADSLSDLLSFVAPPVFTTDSIVLDRVLKQLTAMHLQQPLFEKTGGVHAAGLLFAGRDDAVFVREDIGRHNAVDKVFGSLLSEPEQIGHPVALLLSGRCGWDIVAKAARMGVPVVASIGAASQLAAEVARSNGISLVTFGRTGTATVIGAIQGRFQAKD